MAIQRVASIAAVIIFLTFLSGCGGTTRSTLVPTPPLAPQPVPTPAPSSNPLGHPFAFLRSAATPSDVSAQAAHRDAKLAHAMNREAAVASTLDAADIYIVGFAMSGGWIMGKEVKITASGGPYTSVHISWNETSLVYSAVVNGYNQIFSTTVPAEGQTLGATTQLTFDPEHHWLPNLSAAGDKVVFTKYDAASASDRICTIDNSAGALEACLDFSATTPVLKGSNLWHASWMPDGTIVFEAWGGPYTGDDIFRVKGDGSALTQITNNTGTGWYDENPSPDSEGKYVALASCGIDSGNCRVEFLDMNTKSRSDMGTGWDPLIVYYTSVWLYPSATAPQIYFDFAWDIGALTNNSSANYFERHPR